MSYVVGATVVDVVDHAACVREYCLKLDKFRKYDAGSFVQLTLEQVTPSQVWPDSRTFSIASYSSEYITLIIQRVGYYTNRIFDELRLGSRCTLKYPFGDLFNKNHADDKHIFLAGGLGITPFFSLLDYFQQQEKQTNLHLLYSVKHTSDILYQDKITSALQNRAQYFTTREPESGYNSRRIVLEDILDISGENRDTHLYICGSKDFNDHFASILRSVGFSSIHMDEWE